MVDVATMPVPQEPVRPPITPRTFPGASLIPDAERLAADHQRVTLHNTHREQTFIIIDRGLNPYSLRPDEKKEFDLLVEDIAYFLRERLPERGKCVREGKIVDKPDHPIVVMGIDISQVEERLRKDLTRQKRAQQEADIVEAVRKKS